MIKTFVEILVGWARADSETKTAESETNIHADLETTETADSETEIRKIRF